MLELSLSTMRRKLSARPPTSQAHSTSTGRFMSPRAMASVERCRARIDPVSLLAARKVTLVGMSTAAATAATGQGQIVAAVPKLSQK